MSALTTDPVPDLSFVTQISAESRDGLYAIGRMFYERQDHVRAADVFRLLVLAAPTEARGWLALAASHEAADDDDRARELYRIAIEATEPSPERTTAIVYLARLSLRERDVAEAHRLLEQVIDEDELDPEVLGIAASIRRSLRRAS